MRRFFALLLTLTLLLGSLTPLAFAEEETTKIPEGFVGEAPSNDPGASTAASEGASDATEPSTDAVTEPQTDADGNTVEPTQPVSYGPGTSAETPGKLYDFGYEPDFSFDGSAGLLLELSTGTILYQFNIDDKVYPASLTKIMTCMLAIENGDMEDNLTVSASAFEGLSEYGSTAGLLQGETLPLEEVLYCVMVSSANEACNVVAEYIAGDQATFVELMNQKAQKLGMTGTHFMNAHGLHDWEHYTTVRDLSILARWAWSNETFRKFATTVSHVVPETNLSPARELHTTNALTSQRESTDYYYSYARGIKTGYTSAAGGCLISTADNGEMELMCVSCGCPTRTANDGSEIDMRFVVSKRLYEMGFETYGFRQVLTDTAMLDQPKVTDAEGRDSVVVRASEDAVAVLPIEVPAEEIKIETSYSRALTAPLSAGEVVGTANAVYHGRILASADLVTLTAVERRTASPVDQLADSTSGGKTSWFLRYWFLTVPLTLLLCFIVLLFVVRSINIRRERKRRAERRRRAAAARRRRDGRS